ncbi:hypothetical protein [Neisseria meningitidis]|uniref:hypothetical protein n=1 Tax=Neisseria meningitidis TaxID=487 RepID=UPI001FD23675|nr:hypothetical protein [Neisseria meningitidis]
MGIQNAKSQETVFPISFRTDRPTATGTDAAKKIDTKHLPSTCRDAASVVCIETPPTAFYKNT